MSEIFSLTTDHCTSHHWRSLSRILPISSDVRLIVILLEWTSYWSNKTIAAVFSAFLLLLVSLLMSRTILQDIALATQQVVHQLALLVALVSHSSKSHHWPLLALLVALMFNWGDSAASQLLCPTKWFLVFIVRAASNKRHETEVVPNIPQLTCVLFSSSLSVYFEKINQYSGSNRKS